MTDFYMGMELPPELPPGTPKPDMTPPEGVVLQKIGMDGWNRKYLYQAGLGEDGRRFERKMLVAEIPPDFREVPRNPMGMGNNVERPSARANNVERPSTSISMPGRAPSTIASPVQIISQGPRLGQIAPAGQAAPSATPDGTAQGPTPLACPGPVEMPDGKTLNPDDPITLKYLCDILPYLVENLRGMMAPQGPRTGPVPLTGQAGGPYATAISPPSGMFGQGGAPGGGSMTGFPSGGGGGPGPRGLPGPAGIGAAPDFVTKMDGDFSAGPGAFIAVPGTRVAFVQASDGAAIFFLQAVFGCSGLESQSDQIGLRLTDSNGVITDFPLSVTLLHTGVANVGVFFQPAPGMWPANLVAGSYTIEVILRGLSFAEFCSGSGLGFAATVSGNPQVPLALVAFHR